MELTKRELFAAIAASGLITTGRIGDIDRITTKSILVTDSLIAKLALSDEDFKAETINK